MPEKIPPKKILVVFIQRVPWAGGAERVVLDIVRHLDRTRFTPVIYCLYKGASPPKELGRDIPFLDLIPADFPAFAKAWFSGRLKGEERAEWKYLVPDLSFEQARRQLPVILNSLQNWIRARSQALRSKIRLRTRLRKLRKAWQAGQFSAFVMPRLCRRLGIAYDGPFYTPQEAPPAKAVPSPPAPDQPVPPSAENEADEQKTYAEARPIDIFRQARLIAALAGNLRGPAVFVPVMEEAAAATRLGIGGKGCGMAPFIAQTHAWESYYLPIMYPSSAFDIATERRWFSDACQGAYAVTSPSAGCRDDLVTELGSPPETTLTLPNPVDLEMIRRLALRPLERPLPKESEGKKFFISVGRYDKEKNHLCLFRACALLRERADDFYLLCLGGGYYKAQLESTIKELALSGHVGLFGATANPFPYYKPAVAHVSASLSESFGLVYAEALACGCVNIATDTFGARDVLDNGKSGFITAQNSPEELADAMYICMSQPERAAEKVRYGQEWIRQYDRQHVVRQWELLLSHVAGQFYPL
jgi:glycosyltransferase involved in cell wall biosynthesis